MRIAIVSDIHGNLDAFNSVLSDIDQSRVEAIVSLGDIVGYGPEPRQVVELIQKRNIPSVIGNHELAITDERILECFNPLARQSIQKTVELLNESALDYLCRLERCAIRYGCRFVHGLPPRSATTYLFEVTDDKLGDLFGEYTEPLCFIGHTHTLELLTFDGLEIVREPLREGIKPLSPGRRHLVNCGSVGQPRDLNNKAKYLILDTAENHLEVRFVSYDISAVVQKILAAGLPEAHAARLW